MIQYHDKFLNVVLFRCLLTKKALPVLTLIENALNSIMKFCCQLLLHQARPYTLTNIHYAFKESAGLLYRGIYLRSLELMVLIYSHSDSEIGQKRLSATFRGVPPTFKFQWLL